MFSTMCWMFAPRTKSHMTFFIISVQGSPEKKNIGKERGFFLGYPVVTLMVPPLIFSPKTLVFVPIYLRHNPKDDKGWICDNTKGIFLYYYLIRETSHHSPPFGEYFC